ncbi:MAG: cytochrome C oxidase subunit IV family protein [Actinomycetota bacterium]
MSETATAPTHDGHDHHDEHHPTETQYWIVFVALVILTAVEVAWSFIGLSGLVLVLPLLAMMLVKFLLVAGAFMHLYFDMKLINGRLFTWAFGGALVLALGVYFVVFATFEFSL